MHLRRSILTLAAVFVVAINALPAPQLPAPIANLLGGDGSTDTGSSNGTSAETGLTTPVVSETSKQQTSLPTVVTTPIVPTTAAQETPTTSAVVNTPTTSIETPLTSSQPIVETSSVAPVTTAQPSTTVAAGRVQTTSDTPTSTTPVPTTFPPLTTHATQTYPAYSTGTSTSTAVAQNDQQTSSGGVNTKTILIVGGTVGGFVILAFIAFSIFRKLKLKPSREFESRMEPATSQGHLEEWNDPRTFRGYMQNSSSGASLGRSNSNASSKYSFDAADEKAGGGAAAGGVTRGNTIRQFQFGVEKPVEQGDGLREDGRGYRGF